MKILFLHGWQSVVGGVKPTYLVNAGHDVANPALDHDDFHAAMLAAQRETDRFMPDVIVGSSRGAALALHLRVDAIPMVLLCPAWKRYGDFRPFPRNSLILHSREDEVIPYDDSVELLRRSHVSADRLIEIGSDHRLADPVSLQTMLNACIRLWSETP